MLLESKEFSEKLFEAINNVNDSIIIFSAFVKTSALDKFINLLSDKKVDVKLVVRWQKHDLLTGASDLNIYKLCRKNGWEFGVDLNLHGKLFLVDHNEIFLGSANLTRKGLHLGMTGNNEFGTKLTASEVDLLKIDRFVRDEVTWINDCLFDEIKKDIDSCEIERSSAVGHRWTSHIKKYLNKRVEHLWIRELLSTSPGSLMNVDFNSKSHLLDFELLNLDLDSMSDESLKVGFRNTRLYHWILDKLFGGEELRFGEFSSILHSSILDSKAPYRKEVKEYVSVLFSWFKFLDDEFEVTKYSRTSSVKLKGK